MVIEFTTRTGSRYTIDTVRKTWKRPYNPSSPYLRTEEGTYHEMDKVALGRRIVIICPPLVEGSHARIIATAEVTSMSVKY